ncbi:hypothetical protein [Cerasicoccus frondis]|uniref:hypothetical protein n=1 Tax=Cerasicoccus frondis TaxID=490090 RepID=UPI002852CCFF|nr:hypothetical protein [Cerasicoccus frondis]
MLVFLCGCDSTQAHRARQYSEAFGGLDAGAQKRALDGGIAIGDSRQAVYIALGAPQAQSKVENVETWEYTARPMPSETPFTDGSEQYYLTPNSGAWSPDWADNSGYLYLEFVDGRLDLWDYQKAGYQLKMQHGSEIRLPD